MPKRYFRYFNPNPSKSDRMNDCSIRALCVALDEDWLTVFDELAGIARCHYTMLNDMENIVSVLEAHGFAPYKIVAKKGVRRPTMQDLIKQYPNKIIFGHCRSYGSHVMCARKGLVMDTWDSSARPLYKYWMKDEFE